MSKVGMRLFVGLFALAGVLLAGAQAMAQSAADFFKGKTMTYVVATSPGGGYDTYARLIAEHMTKYLPVDKIVVKNVPGAGHIIGANQVYAAKPDGLTIGTFNTGLIYAQLLGREGIQFDLTKFTWIGKAAADPRTIVVSTKSDIMTFEDLANSSEEVNFAAAGPGSSAYNEIKMLNAALGLPIKLITGYRGQEGEMAMMRGEVVGQMASLSSMEPFIANGFGRAILQIGGTSGPGGAPLASAIITEGKGKSLVDLIGSQAELARLTAAPPGVPADRAALLISAYKSALEDAELLAQAEKLGRPIEPLYGDDVANLVKAALNQSSDTVALVTSILEEEAEPSGTKVRSALLEVSQDGRNIVFNGPDGSPVKSKVSGSRTKITIDGKDENRKNLKQGMECDVTYEPGEENEPSLLTCAALGGKLVGPPPIIVLNVTSPLLTVSPDGRNITFNGPKGDTVKSKVSGSRTKVMIAGAESNRKNLKEGMNCEIEYTPGEDNEPSMLSCQ